ncbi:MAG: flavodoxin family protein [Phycisphaerae bacterium]
MARALVVYYSRTGNTERMAEAIAKAIGDEGVDVECKPVADTTVQDLLQADGIVAGSPTYYGGMAAELKGLFDRSVEHHGELDGKVGAAFSSAANIGGGNETTVLAIIRAMLIHGMIVQGDPQGDHYGPIAIGQPDRRSLQECRRRGQRFARLLKQLKG